MELLQKYIFITLDNFLKLKQNKDISNRLNAWFLFLGSDDPEDVIRLIETYPDFEAMYRQIYEICENVENVMGLFSEELARIDKNTVRYMMHEMQEEIDQKDATIAERDATIAEQDIAIAEKDATIAEQDIAIAEKDAAIAERDAAIAEKDAAYSQKDEENKRLRKLLASLNIQI